jgi:hypothetical protein
MPVHAAGILRGRFDDLCGHILFWKEWLAYEEIAFGRDIRKNV